MEFLDKENKNIYNKGGIYQIKNIRNNKIYIGSTCCFKTRYKNHFKELRNKTHGNGHLKASFNKSPKNFIFQIIEVVFLTGNKKIDRQILIDAEQKYLDVLFDGGKNCYNLLPKSWSCLGKIVSTRTRKLMSQKSRGRKHTEENKKHLSRLAKERYKNPENNPFYGKKHTKETKDKISQANSGKNSVWYGKSHTKETIEKMRKTKSKKSKITYQYNKNTKELINIFPSIKAAARTLNANSNNITSCCNKKLKSAYGFIWSNEKLYPLNAETIKHTRS